MRLLLISTENEVDQVMVVVPDDYNQKEVLAEAKDMLNGDPSIDCDIDIGDEAKYGFSTYRMYVG